MHKCFSAPTTFVPSVTMSYKLHSLRFALVVALLLVRKWHNLRVRFSLRLFFGLVTAASVVFGWIACERRQALRELQIVAELQMHFKYVTAYREGCFSDASLRVDRLPTLRREPVWRRCLNVVFGERVWRLDLRQRVRDSNVSPEFKSNKECVVLSQLNDMSNLESLSFDEIDSLVLPKLDHLERLTCLRVTRSSSVDISAISSLRSLQECDLEFSFIHDLAPIAKVKQLKRLNISFTRISDLSPLVHVESLQTLRAEDTLVTDVTPLAALTNLRRLNCWGSPIHDIAPLRCLVNLEDLNLRDTNVTNIEPLLELSRLRRLGIGASLRSSPRCEMLQRVNQRLQITP